MIACITDSPAMFSVSLMQDPNVSAATKTVKMSAPTAAVSVPLFASDEPGDEEKYEECDHEGQVRTHMTRAVEALPSCPTGPVGQL